MDNAPNAGDGTGEDGTREAASLIDEALSLLADRAGDPSLVVRVIWSDDD